MIWHVEVTARLLEQRRAGELDFALAWRRATRGLERPRDFCKGDPDIIPFTSWYREQARREWYGELHADYAGLRDLIADDSPADRVRVSPTSTERAVVIA